MVFYFTSTVVDPPITLFMGLDKHESKKKRFGIILFYIMFCTVL